MSCPNHTFKESLYEEGCVRTERPGKIDVDYSWYNSALRQGPLATFAGWNKLYPSTRRVRIAEAFSPYPLKPQVIELLVRADWASLKRIINVVEALRDNIMFADPQRFPQISQTSEFRKLISWSISTEIYCPGEAVAQWKKFCTVVKWKAAQSLTEEPERPNGFPGFPINPIPLSTMGFPKLWSRICPWLWSIWDWGVQTKFECTRLAHFTTSRNMPAASVKRRKQTLKEHASVICSEFQCKEARTEFLFDLGVRAGIPLRGNLSSAHLSLTNSASIDSPINQGGRGRKIAEQFRIWISQVPSETVHGITWFSKPYWLEAGVPLWRTMCRTTMAREGRAGDSASIDTIDFTPGKFRYEDPIHCLDSNTGYLLLQWSLEKGIEEKVIEGDRYRRSMTSTLRVSGVPSIRAAAIGEPGNKARVVTVGEDWLTILLQPLAHGLTDVLRRDPSARAGLSRGWQAFEYCKTWSSKSSEEKPSPRERFILSSDLKTATDYCPHPYAKALLSGFITGLGMTSAFTQLWVDLLVSPRVYRGPVPGFRDCLTSRGVLMGDPGTKLVLSLFNKAAEMEAILRSEFRAEKASCRFLQRLLAWKGIPNTRYRLFAFAGDDHVAIGPQGYLREISKSHHRNGMMVSWPSNFVSAKCGYYCEEILFIGNPRVWNAWGTKIPLFRQSYEDNPHVDALKLRLLSQCSKEHEGKNESNPAVGMSPTIRGMVAWFAEGWEPVKPLVSLRFSQKMGKLLPQNLVLRGLPNRLGGLEAPVFHVPKDVLWKEWTRLPEVLRKTIVYVLREDANPSIRRILSSFSSNTCARGIESDSIEESVREVLSSALCCCRNINDFRADAQVSQLDWDNMRYWEKAKFASSQGFLTIGEAIQTVCRPYTFRDILFPEESIAHGIDPYRRRAYRQLPWNLRLRRMVLALEDSKVSDENFWSEILDVTDEQEEEVCASILDKMSEKYLPSVPKEVLLIPKEVVITENLCTLRTPGIH